MTEPIASDQQPYVPQIGDIRKHPKGGLWVCIRLNRFHAPSAWWVPQSCMDDQDFEWYAQFLPNSLWEEIQSEISVEVNT